MCTAPAAPVQPLPHDAAPPALRLQPLPASPDATSSGALLPLAAASDKCAGRDSPAAAPRPPHADFAACQMPTHAHTPLTRAHVDAEVGVAVAAARPHRVLGPAVRVEAAAVGVCVTVRCRVAAPADVVTPVVLACVACVPRVLTATCLGAVAAVYTHAGTRVIRWQYVQPKQTSHRDCALLSACKT